MRENDTTDLPLLGIKLCCTSIPPERRSLLASAAVTLGATHSLDLTSDVTHLLVGDINTPKYAYVSRERPDIHVLRPDFIDAVLRRWQAGEDDTELDLAALEKEYKCPAFWGLRVCVTGFDNFEERAALQEVVRREGGTYCGDLTRDVTHLVAKEGKGKKFEAAVHWGLKVVGIEWVERSVFRGMALEERLFSVLLPPEERGIGAVKEMKVEEKVELGKRSRDGEMIVQGRRKMRRVATETLEERKDEMWADIGGRSEHEPGDVPKESIVKQEEMVDETNAIREVQQQETVKRIFKSDALKDFSGKFIVYGFDKRKTDIMHKFLSSNGAQIIAQSPDTQHNEEQAVVLLVPHSIPAVEVQTLQLDLPMRTRVVSEWWVEKCLHEKRLIDESQTPLSQPLQTATIPGFDRLTICPTSFSGIDLLHLSKAVKLMGAKYDETLRNSTSVLICNEAVRLNTRKVQYALENSIPVVSAQWFYESIKKGSILVYADFCISGASASSAADQMKVFWHPVHNPRPQREVRKLMRDGGGTGGLLEKDAETSKDKIQQKKSRQDRNLQDENVQVHEPLKDLPPEQNSPKKEASRRSENKFGKRMPFADDDDEDDNNAEYGLYQADKPEVEAQIRQDEDGGFLIVNNANVPNEQESIEQEDDNKDEEDTFAIVENSIINIGDDSPNDIPFPTMPLETPPNPLEDKSAKETRPPTLSITTTTTSTQQQARLTREITDIKTRLFKRTTTDSASSVAESPIDGTEANADNTSVAAPPQQHPRKHRPLGRAPSNPTALLSRASTVASADSTTTSVASLSHTNSTHQPIPLPAHHEEDEIDALLHRPHKHHIDADLFRPSQALSYEDPEAIKLKAGIFRQLGMDGVMDEESEVGRVKGIEGVKDRVRATGSGGGVRRRSGRKK